MMGSNSIEQRQRDGLDRKYVIDATNICTGRQHTEQDSILFLAKDNCFAEEGPNGEPSVMDYYARMCRLKKANARQIRAAELLCKRVRQWRRVNPLQCKLADVAEGMEEQMVCSID